MTVDHYPNPPEMDNDIQRKLQIYGIWKAFQGGKVPSNEQIDITLNSFIQSRALSNPSDRLSKEGRNLIQDFRSVLEQVQFLILTKNRDEIVQDFIWKCESIDFDNRKATVPGAPLDQETAQQHGQQAKNGFKTLGQLIITNGEFRKLLDDAVVLLRDIAGDAATNAAGKVKPSEHQLNQVDRPADNNIWHDSPNMSSGNIKNQMKQAFKKNQPVDRGDVRDAVGNASQNAHPNGSRDPVDTAQLAGRDQQSNTASGIDGQAGAQAGAATVKQRASENVPEETKQRGRETRDRTKKYLQGKMPEERREQLIYRLKKMIVEIQGHSDYMQAITTLLDLVEQYGGHAQHIGQQGSGAVKGVRADDAVITAERDLKTLLERFANYTSSDDFTDSINAIYQDADKDPELKGWFKQLNGFIRRCLQEQGYMMEEDSTARWNELYERGNFLLRERYRPHTDRIVDEIKFLAHEFDNDPQNKRFAETCQKLFHDLGNDENGKPKFKKHLVEDLVNVIIPAAFQRIRYMPIPRLEYRDPKTELVIENLVIESNDLTPTLLEVSHESNFRFGRKGLESKKRGSVSVTVSGVQMDLKKVAYHFKRRGRSPVHYDEGLIDILLGGNGLSFKMKMSTANKEDKQNFLKVDSVKVDIKNFKLKIYQSKHKHLFTLAKAILIRPLTKAISKALEAAIKQKFEEADAFAYKIKIEADRAQEEAMNNPENAPNIYRNYVSAVQRELQKGRVKAQKVEQAVQEKEFRMVMTMDKSMFPDVTLPGGITSKATEYKDLAKTGQWESPVFKIGSAKGSDSSKLPPPRNVERKPHPVTQGEIRGPQNLGNTGSMNSGGPSGYNQNTQQGSPLGYGQQGFNQHVDQAFGNVAPQPATVGTGLLGNSGATNSAATGGGTLSQKNVATNNGHTQLGANNPVLQGRV